MCVVIGAALLSMIGTSLNSKRGCENMNEKMKCYIFCVLESLFMCIVLTALILTHSVIYPVIILLVVCLNGYFREKMRPVLSLHEQILWSTGPFSLFLALAYIAVQDAILFLAAAVSLAGCILEWKYNLFSKRHKWTD